MVSYYTSKGISIDRPVRDWGLLTVRVDRKELRLRHPPYVPVQFRDQVKHLLSILHHSRPRPGRHGLFLLLLRHLEVQLEGGEEVTEPFPELPGSLLLLHPL